MNKLPTVFSLSNNLDENCFAGTIVGDFTVKRESYRIAFSLVDGDGGRDNASFELSSVLKSKSMFD
jgi:hypothetical protein